MASPLRTTQDEEREKREANVSMKRSHSIRAQSSGKRVNRTPQHQTVDRNAQDHDDEWRNLTAEIVNFPKKVKKKRVRFASTCKLVIFPRVKAKYDRRIWYSDTDFSNFKKEANSIVEAIHAYNGAYDKVIGQLGVDCVLGLERIISKKVVECRRQWRLSASITVFNIQGRIWQQQVLSEGDGVETRYHYWSAWESIAEYYRNSVAKSKVYALDLAEVYATSNPEELKQMMTWLLGSIDREACCSSTSLESAQPLPTSHETTDEHVCSR